VSNDSPMTTARAFGASVLATGRLLFRRQIRLPRAHLGRRIDFADGSSFRVYRETVRLARDPEPAVLVVRFRLPLVGRSRLLQAMFRAESLLNTPLFAGFPGFRTKLWLTDDHTGEYRGLYDWDGSERARSYATTLAALLRLVCVPGSVTFHVEPHVRRDEYLRRGAVVSAGDAPTDQWWLPRNRETV
jgi:hypothetical protein